MTKKKKTTIEEVLDEIRAINLIKETPSESELREQFLNNPEEKIRREDEKAREYSWRIVQGYWGPLPVRCICAKAGHLVGSPSARIFTAEWMRTFFAEMKWVYTRLVSELTRVRTFPSSPKIGEYCYRHNSSCTFVKPGGGIDPETGFPKTRDPRKLSAPPKDVRDSIRIKSPARKEFEERIKRRHFNFIIGSDTISPETPAPWPKAAPGGLSLRDYLSPIQVWAARMGSGVMDSFKEDDKGGRGVPMPGCYPTEARDAIRDWISILPSDPSDLYRGDRGWAEVTIQVTGEGHTPHKMVRIGHDYSTLDELGKILDNWNKHKEYCREHGGFCRHDDYSGDEFRDKLAATLGGRFEYRRAPPEPKDRRPEYWIWADANGVVKIPKRDRPDAGPNMGWYALSRKMEREAREGFAKWKLADPDAWEAFHQEKDKAKTAYERDPLSQSWKPNQGMAPGGEADPLAPSEKPPWISERNGYTEEGRAYMAAVLDDPPGGVDPLADQIANGPFGREPQGEREEDSDEEEG